MADIASNINAEVTPDGAWVGFTRVCGSQHLTAHADYFLAFPDHCEDWS